MSWVERLRERWGGSLRPDVRFDRDAAMIERWDSRNSGPGYSVCFEGFGLSFMLFFGRTPDVRGGTAVALVGEEA